MLLTCLQCFPGPVRFNQTAVTVWGLGLATGCVLFGAILLWGRMEIAHGSYAMKGPSRVVEPSPDAVKRERIAALLLQKSKRQQEDEKWTSGLRNLWLWWILISCSARELRYSHTIWLTLFQKKTIASHQILISNLILYFLAGPMYGGWGPCRECIYSARTILFYLFAVIKIVL